MYFIIHVFRYKKLFLEGHKSDVVINALDNTWYLHRIYLEQCNYFASLFKGSWKDSNEKVYNLEVIDPNVTYEGKFATSHLSHLA